MAEEIRDDLTSILVKEKTEKYSRRPEYDFVLPSELTVTVTLMEYRSLITAKGEYDKEIERQKDEHYKQWKEIEKLKAENEKLKEKVIALLNGETVEEEKESEEA